MAKNSIIPDTPIGKRIQYICLEWQKTRPKKQTSLRHLAEELGISMRTIERGISGNAGNALLDALENKMGYSYEWLVNGEGPKKTKDIVDKKQAYFDVSEINAEVKKLRLDIQGKDSRVRQLETDVQYLTRELKEIKDRLNDSKWNTNKFSNH